MSIPTLITWLTAMDAVIIAALRLYEFGRKLYGKDKIPSWDELITKNAVTQALIDED